MYCSDVTSETARGIEKNNDESEDDILLRSLNHPCMIMVVAVALMLLVGTVSAEECDPSLVEVLCISKALTAIPSMTNVLTETM